MSQWNREFAPALCQHTIRQMDRRPTGMPHKADKLDSAVNVPCRPGIGVPFRGYLPLGATQVRAAGTVWQKNSTPQAKKKNTHLQRTERRKRKAPHEPKEPKVTNKCAMHLRQLSTLQSQLLWVGNLCWRGQRLQRDQYWRTYSQTRNAGKEQNTKDIVCTKRAPDKGEDVFLETHTLNSAQWAGNDTWSLYT